MQPVFNTGGLTGTERQWKVVNINGATGSVQFDNTGQPVSITSTGIYNNPFALTYAYKELTGDFEIKVRLSGFTHYRNRLGLLRYYGDRLFRYYQRKLCPAEALF